MRQTHYTCTTPSLQVNPQLECFPPLEGTGQWTKLSENSMVPTTTFQPQLQDHPTAQVVPPMGFRRSIQSVSVAYPSLFGGHCWWDD
jgi:hypothetical protein